VVRERLRIFDDGIVHRQPSDRGDESLGPASLMRPYTNRELDPRKRGSRNDLPVVKRRGQQIPGGFDTPQVINQD